MFSISFQGACSLFSSAARSPRSRPDKVMHRPDDVGGADPVGLQELARPSPAGHLPGAARGVRASSTVMPAAMTVAESPSPRRRTLDPPTTNFSSLEYRSGVAGRVVLMEKIPGWRGAA